MLGPHRIACQCGVQLRSIWTLDTDPAGGVQIRSEGPLLQPPVWMGVSGALPRGHGDVNHLLAGVYVIRISPPPGLRSSPRSSPWLHGPFAERGSPTAHRNETSRTPRARALRNSQGDLKTMIPLQIL